MCIGKLRFKREFLPAVAVFCALLLLPSFASAAQNAYMELEVDGTLIEGESNVTSLGREGNIEIYSINHDVTVPRDAGTGQVTGAVQHQPLSIVKRVDKSTPLLYHAMVNNQLVTRALIKFYRPSPAGDGTTQHFYSILLENGYITNIKGWKPSTLAPETMSYPDMEEVSFVYQTITWTDEVTGATTTANIFLK